MNELQVIEIKGQRVLTTKQIADAYSTSVETVKHNFGYNKKNFILGKHYISLEGEELKQLKRECEFQTLFKQAKHLYLWTEKGALLHAKSINTDTAWEVYDHLVDFYFRQQSQEKKTEPVKKQMPSVKPLTAAVVDIPVNRNAQKAMAAIRNDIKGIETLLNLCDMYSNEEEYQKKLYVLNQLGFKVHDDIFRFGEVKHGMIEKKL